MRLGPWTVDLLLDRFFALDGGAMFGVVPRVLWSRHHEPDDEGRIRLAARCLLARHDAGPVVLVESGIGDRWTGRARAAFAVQEGLGVVAGLAALGVAPSEVTDVVLTHLHFDHAGGLVRPAMGGGLEPVFPAARVHVQAAQLAWAGRPSPRDRASFRAADFRPLEEAGLVVTREGPGEILPGLEVRVTHGHTVAMQIPLIRGGGAVLAFPSDLVPTLAHVQVPWVMAYDQLPLVTVEEKTALLGEAAREGWVLASHHDPEVAAFTVAEVGGRFEATPRPI